VRTHLLHSLFYTLFTAALDDRILIRATRTSGTLQPNIGVYNASGALVCSAYTGGIMAEISGCTLRSAGQYTLLMDDTGNTKTGDYMVFLQRFNNPGNAQAIAFGQTLSAAISTISEVDAYTFTAAVDDRILVRATRTSGTLQPNIGVYNA
jgi:hypothetical protein